jgi:hypothetical protein
MVAVAYTFFHSRLEVLIKFGFDGNLVKVFFFLR